MSWEDKVQEKYKYHNRIPERTSSYTFHSGDYFSGRGKCPLFLLNDPIEPEVEHFMKDYIESIAVQALDTFYMVIQTTKDLGGIQQSDRFENIWYIKLPKLVLKEDTYYKTNCVGEVASLIFFGELRYRGILSHLWVDYHYGELEHLSNLHFAHIVRESIVSPIYLSPEINKSAYLMGFGYEEYKPSMSKRKLSPIRQKKVCKGNLQSKPTITRPPSPIRESPHSPVRESSSSPVREKPPSPEREKPLSPVRESPSSKQGLSLTEDQSKDRVSTLPPSPIRESSKKASGDRKKPKTIKNPKTGRDIKVGGETYLKLLKKGIIKAETET
jgi:hypothetical protein